MLRPMNVRFSEGCMRCRLSKADLDRLASGRAVILQVDLPRSHAFRLSLQPAVVGGWRLQSDPTGIWVSIPRAEIEALAAAVPSRDGIGETFPLANGNRVRLDVEVDVRDTT